MYDKKFAKVNFAESLQWPIYNYLLCNKKIFGYYNQDNTIFSNVLKFANDTKVYKVVDNKFDGAQRQSDLDSLGDWAVKWQMKFNVEIEKCKVVHYGKKVLMLNTVYMGSILRKQYLKKICELLFATT